MRKKNKDDHILNLRSLQFFCKLYKNKRTFRYHVRPYNTQFYHVSFYTFFRTERQKLGIKESLRHKKIKRIFPPLSQEKELIWKLFCIFLHCSFNICKLATTKFQCAQEKPFLKCKMLKYLDIIGSMDFNMLEYLNCDLKISKNTGFIILYFSLKALLGSRKRHLFLIASVSYFVIRLLLNNMPNSVGPLSDMIDLCSYPSLVKSVSLASGNLLVGHSHIQVLSESEAVAVRP